MFIVLDTNIIQEDFLMRSGRFQIVLDYATRTQSSFLLPQIVAEELAANYERRLREHVTKLTAAQDCVRGLTLSNGPARFECDIPKAVAEYMSHVRKKLRVKEGDDIPYSEANLRDAVARAIKRRRPCSGRGEEIRDAVLWNILLDVAATKKGEVVFISRNISQFSADRSSLHPDLVEEVGSRGLSVHYFPSLEEFARQHATKIAFVTTEWLEEHVAPQEVLDLADDVLIEAASSIARERLGWGVSVSHFRVVHGALDVEEFYVYEMSTGALRVEATWYGQVGVSFDSEEESLEGDWRRTQRRTVELRLHAVTDVVVEVGDIVNWSLTEAWAQEY